MLGSQFLQQRSCYQLLFVRDPPAHPPRRAIRSLGHRRLLVITRDSPAALNAVAVAKLSDYSIATGPGLNQPSGDSTIFDGYATTTTLAVLNVPAKPLVADGLAKW